MDEKHGFTKSLAVVGFWLFALLWGDEARVRMGEGFWLSILCILAVASVVLIAPSAIDQARKAYQHKYGGRAQAELYTVGHVPIRGWRRVWTYTSPYLVCISILILAGWIGWSVIENVKAYGSLPISFRAGAFTRFPVSDNPITKEAVVLQLAELVNHSKDNLSLEFRLLVRLRTTAGERSGMMEIGEWRNGPFGKKGVEGVQILNLIGESTVGGTLIFRFPGLDQWDDFKGQKWKDVGDDKFILMITDKVSGKTIHCSPLYYQAGFEKWFADIE